MQAEYRKEQNETYLWIIKEKTSGREYAEKMLIFNQGEGRLEFSKRQEEGQEYYCYRITGKKALNGIYAMMSIEERQIRSILKQIFQITDAAKEYMHEESDFVIQPGYIFATLPKMEVELCCVPGYGKPLKEQLEGFFEYLLNRVNYEDKKAVELLYDCYVLCVREHTGIWEIRDRIEKESEGRGEEQRQENCPEEKTQLYYEEKGEQMETGAREEAPPSYVTWLTDRFFHRKKREALLVAEQREEYHVEKQPGKQKEPEELRLEEKTVLLSGAEEKEEPQLIDEKTGEVIYLKKFPFYIGCVGKYADYVLSQSGVSRIHCCINKKEEGFYLSDLNSTNGTYLGEKEVLPGKEERLSDGMLLRIAKTEFYVKLPCH